MQLFLRKFFTIIIILLINMPDGMAEEDLEYSLKEYIQNYLNADEITLNLNNNDKEFVKFANNVEIIKIDFDEKYRKFTAYLNDNQKNITLQGRYEEKINIPVLKTKLKKGELISSNNLENKLFSKHKLHPETIVDSNDLIGKTTPKFILNNKPILHRDIQEPYLIRKNDLVTVKYKTNNINLTLTAIALNDGIKGDLVKVKNTNSNNIITAIIIDNKLAVVQ